MLGKTSASDIKSNVGKSGLDWLSLSAAMPNAGAFANILNSVTPSASASATTPSSNDPIAQLTSLVQNGMPLSTIVNAIAQSLSGSVQQQLTGTMSQSALDNLRSSLLQSITNALSPPSNAPPGSATQQVTALAARLQRLISAVARELKTTAGQKNEISGNVLDATSAKELPAQQKTNDTSSQLDVSSLMRSILSNAVVAVQGAVAHVAPVHPAPAPGKTALQPNSAPLVSSAANLASPSPGPAMPASPGVTPASSQAPVDTGSASSITIANAPDLLARMLVRAAGADAGVTGSAGAATARTGNDGSDTTSSLTTIAARFAAAISDGVAGVSQPQNGQTNANAFGREFAANDQTELPKAQSAPSGTTVAVATSVANAQLQNLLQPQPAAASSVDVNAVLEQMIKSMSMRTNAQGTSEIRLHLQPENLGNVTMKITVTGSQISANVVAQNADVRNVLVSNHQQLAKSLADAGLTLTGFSVDVSGGDAKQQQNQGQTSGFGRRYVVHELGGLATNEDATISNLGPPLVSGPGIGLFNYLA